MGKGPKRSASASSTVPENDGRERILEVAIRSFAERGYAGTTTAGVAREAGVTQPLVHHHFGSKDGLWRAAIDKLFGAIPALLASTGSELPPDEQLLAMVDGFVRLSAARPEIARIIAREGAAPSPRLDYLLTRYVGRAFQQVVSTVWKAQREGLVAPELRPELLLFFALGAGGHLFDVPALARSAFGIDTSSPATRDEYVELFGRVLRSGVLRGRQQKR